MTFDELYNPLNAIIRDIKSNAMGNMMVQIGVTATTMIRKRIIETGKNADGGDYGKYSEKPMLVGCKTFKSKDCNKFFNSPSIEWKSIRKKGITKPAKGQHNKKEDYWRLAVLEHGYKELREITLGSDKVRFIDFSFSGQMWRNIKVYSSNTEHNQGIVRIGATTPLDQAKLAGNTEKKGPILKLSKEEIKTLSGIAKKELIQIFHNNGL